MNRTDYETKKDLKKLLAQAREMKNWELIEEAVYSYSHILKEIKKKEPVISVIDNCKLIIAAVEQVLNERMDETDRKAVNALKEIYKEVTELFSFLFAVHQPAALQLNGDVSPEKQTPAEDPAIPLSPGRRKVKRAKVIRRG